MRGTQAAAASIYQAMRERGYSTDTWGQHELHPKRSEGFSAVDMVNFVFTMDLLNFSWVWVWAFFFLQELFLNDAETRDMC